jgi:SNF2 family DNA or RNA helicase
MIKKIILEHWHCWIFKKIYCLVKNKVTNKKMEASEALTTGEPFLTEEQISVVNECMQRDVFGLSLHMGSGKSILSLIIGLKRKIESDNKEPLLVIASKSLIPSWAVEINKFFGSTLKYQIINVDSRNFVINPDTILILVTAETAGKFYKENMISEKFIAKEKYTEPGVRFPLVKNVYDSPTSPYLKTANGGSIIYQKKWSALIIDEGHKYTKISSARCQALGAICAKYRFILSGTLFDEPDFERILGYYVILHWPGFPKDLPEATKFLKSGGYRGTKETIVERNKIELIDVKINKHIVQHDLSEEEGQIYVSMKKTLSLLRDYCKRSTRKEDRKKFSTYILSMLVYIRQSVVIPILPIANITLEMSELNDIRSELTVLLMDQFNKLNLQTFLNSEASAKSTRVKKVIEVILKHNKPTDKIVVFSCFCTSLDMLRYYVNEDVPIDIYRLESSMSVVARGKLIDEFQKSEENSVLLTSFELGSEGLNLQCANVVIILDMWWNQAKIQQAVARVVRRGQKAKEVDVYFFTSNTGIEKCLFQKQQDKLILLDQIRTGTIKHEVKTLRMEEVLRLVDTHENYNYLQRMY